MILEGFLIFSLTFVFYIAVQLHLRRRPKNFPPGPRSWPIFGNMLQLGSKQYEAVMALRGKYGDIIGIDLGERRTVFINEYKLLKEACNLPALVARPNFHHFAEEETGIVRGMIFSSGQIWAEQRKFAFTYLATGLRDTVSMEHIVAHEATELIEGLRKTCGKPIDTRHVFTISSLNSLWNIVAGKRYSHDDPEFQKITKHSAAIATSPVMQGILVFFPEFSKMFPTLSGYKKFRSDLNPLREYVKTIIDEHRETYKEGIQRDFIDAYLNKIKNTTDPNSTFYGKKGETNLVHTLYDYFLAGTDTVATALCWTLFLLSHFPEVQTKLINSIKSFGKGQHISLSDKQSLPYVEALIKEVLRFCAQVPLGVLREATEDIEFHGYTLPKGTVVVSNQYGILHDPEVWGDPENFRPERFLSEDGSKVISHPAFVPFGAGRRICPGDTFGKDEFFLFLTKIFQNFRVTFDPSSPKPALDHIVGSMNTPVAHKIVFHKLSE